VAHSRSVRLAKQKIDRQVEKKSGYNVKLGRGGIREIEFIAQALQLAHGGRDEWLRAPHTLVSLGRLADRGFITQPEHSELSDAYSFYARSNTGCRWSTGCKRTQFPKR
jgi:glutamate-ammonia-ligase adenylyltransferase